MKKHVKTLSATLAIATLVQTSVFAKTIPSAMVSQNTYKNWDTNMQSNSLNYGNLIWNFNYANYETRTIIMVC